MSCRIPEPTATPSREWCVTWDSEMSFLWLLGKLCWGIDPAGDSTKPGRTLCSLSMGGNKRPPVKDDGSSWSSPRWQGLPAPSYEAPLLNWIRFGSDVIVIWAMLKSAKRSESLDRLRSARPIDFKVVRMCLRTAEALLTPLRIFLTGGPGYPTLTQGLRKFYARRTRHLHS